MMGAQLFPYLGSRVVRDGPLEPFINNNRRNNAVRNGALSGLCQDFNLKVDCFSSRQISIDRITEATMMNQSFTYEL